MSGSLHIGCPRIQLVTWKILDFSALPRGAGSSVQSPEFRFEGASYCLRLYPEGRKKFKCGAYVDIVLVKLDSTPHGKNVSYTVWLKSKEGAPLTCKEYRCPAECVGGIEHYMEWQVVDENVTDSDSLTVFCEMSDRGRGWNLRVKGTSYEESERKGLSGVEDLLFDYKQLLQKNTCSDTCLVVSGEEFQAHKCILRARSTVFDAMFDHEKPESGRVEIEDLDPEIFRIFLKYLYTGNVGASLTDENAFVLYKVAEKYDVPSLKSECVEQMRKSLSEDHFCEVLSYAQRRDPAAEDIMELAVEFFRQNMSRVVINKEWGQFIMENPECVKDLLIKAAEPRIQRGDDTQA